MLGRRGLGEVGGPRPFESLEWKHPVISPPVSTRSKEEEKDHEMIPNTLSLKGDFKASVSFVKSQTCPRRPYTKWERLGECLEVRLPFAAHRWVPIHGHTASRVHGGTLQKHCSVSPPGRLRAWAPPVGLSREQRGLAPAGGRWELPFPHSAEL